MPASICRNFDVLGSVFRTAPLAGAPNVTASGSVFAFRKRLDGGYTIARRNANIADITPDSFRLLLQYFPTLRQNYGEIRMRLGRRFLEEWGTAPAGRWTKPHRSRPCACWIQRRSKPRWTKRGPCCSRTFPAFAGMQVAESWGGLIDVTPDAVPVIDQVAGVPGFFLATGFSGHGFGIGPGAGRLRPTWSPATRRSSIPHRSVSAGSPKARRQVA